MRVWLTILGLIIFMLIGVSTIWWFFASSLGERQLASAQKRLAQQGYVLEFGNVERSGFPASLEWMVHDVSITAPPSRDQAGSAEPVARGRADLLYVSAKPWSPQRLTYRVDGKHVWHVQTQGETGLLEVVIGKTGGSIRPRDDEAGWFLNVKMESITAQPQAPETPPLLIAEAEVAIEMPLSMNAMTMDAQVKDVVLPRDTGLGRALQTALFKGRIDPLPRSFSATDLKAWQSAGGLLTVDDASLQFGPVQGSGGGVVGLDSALRGQGNMTLRLHDPQKLISAGIAAGWLQDQQRQMLNLALGLFSRRSSSAEAEVALPLNMRNGGLWIGPIRLLDLPPVVAQ